MNLDKESAAFILYIIQLISFLFLDFVFIFFVLLPLLLVFLGGNISFIYLFSFSNFSTLMKIKEKTN